MSRIKIRAKLLIPKNLIAFDTHPKERHSSAVCHFYGLRLTTLFRRSFIPFACYFPFPLPIDILTLDLFVMQARFKNDKHQTSEEEEFLESAQISFV